MFNLKDITKKLHDSVMEPDNPVPTPVKPETSPILGRATAEVLMTPPVQYRPLSSPSPTFTSDSNDPIYQALKSISDFDSTDVGKQVADHLATLSDLDISESEKMKVVLKAGAKQGLTAEKIVQTIDSLLANLDGEQSKFDNSVAKKGYEKIDNLKKDINEEAEKVKTLEQQITDSRKRQSDLSTDVISADADIKSKISQFSTAFNTRLGDLKTLSSKYKSILKG